ncbi:tetratricopeptide repeat protein [Methanospirillum lacunae]
MSRLPLHILLVFMAILVMTGCPASALSADQVNDSAAISSQPDRHKEIIEAYDNALKIHPKTGPAWVIRGMNLYGLGRYEEAIEAYDQALNLSPKDAGIYASKGLALSKLDKYDEAIEMYNQALTIDPDYSFAWNAKGLVLSKEGKTQEAIKAFDQALAIDPENVKVQENREAALKLLNS